MALDQLPSFMRAISSQESSNRPDVVNSRSGAHGLFQIMPNNWAPWSRETFGRVMPRTAQNQQAVAKHKMGQYYQQFNSWDAVAVAWFAGPGRAQRYVQGDRSVLNLSDGGMTVGQYIAKMRQGMGAQGAQAGFSPTPGPGPAQQDQQGPFRYQQGALARMGRRDDSVLARGIEDEVLADDDESSMLEGVFEVMSAVQNGQPLDSLTSIGQSSRDYAGRQEVRTPPEMEPEEGGFERGGQLVPQGRGDYSGVRFGLSPSTSTQGMAGLKPGAMAGAQLARQLGFAGTIHGVGHRGNKSDHPGGNAIDLMTGRNMALGSGVANFYVANRDQLGVKYVIFNQAIASANTGWRWRRMADRGSPTANHVDHPHVSFH